MQNIFQQVQDSFMDLGVLLSGLDLNKDRISKEALTEVHAALLSTYSLFDQGLCEKAYMCPKCLGNKEQLRKLVEMISECDKNGKLSREADVALVEFMYVIPQTLAELKTVYLESLSAN